MKKSLKSREFYSYFVSSQSLVTGDLYFKYTLDGDPRIGFVVSKKYGSAVERNLLKRRCRSLFSNLLKSGFRHTLIVRPRGHHLSFAGLQNSFGQIEQGANH